MTAVDFHSPPPFNTLLTANVKSNHKLDVNFIDRHLDCYHYQALREQRMLDAKSKFHYYKLNSIQLIHR